MTRQDGSLVIQPHCVSGWTMAFTEGWFHINQSKLPDDGGGGLRGMIDIPLTKGLLATLTPPHTNAHTQAVDTH